MCIFCSFDNSKVENTIIEETENFYVLPAVGSLVDGYLLIVSKRHVNSMADLNDVETSEYIGLIDKYRNKFFKIYQKSPIVFEHGTPIVASSNKTSSVYHAHTHIVNHNFKDEKSIISELKFKKINNVTHIVNDKNYISYINPLGINMVSYKFPSISQLMRKYIACDLGMDDKYSWRDFDFMNNIILTIDKFK